MSPQRVVAEPEQQALDRLVGVVLAMPRAEREAWLAGLPADDLDLVEQALADVTAVGWRADPATMAAHLDATFKTYRYVQLLSRKWREACDGTSKRQIWNLQGRLGKSTLAQWGTVWRFDNRPDARFIFWSYGKSLAVENAVGVRDRLSQHADVVRCQLRADRRRMDRFVTAEGGGLVAAGPGSVVRGFGAGNGGGIVFDDPFKNWQEAHSANRRELVWNEVRSLYDRLDDEQAFIIHVHHRVHEDDVTARLLAEEERGGDVWDHVVLPALAVGPDDPLGREEGEPVEAERFSVAFLQQQARSMGSYLASALQQQQPAAAEGTELLREWFRLYEVPPAGADQKITSWDLKLKDREAGDFVVGQVWWRTGPDVWLRDQLRGKWDHATTANAIALLAVRHPDVRTHVVEAAGSADEVLPQLRRPVPGYVVDDAMRGRLGMTEDEAAAVEALRRRGMGGLVPHPPKMAKPIRARTYIVPTAEAGNLHVPGYAEWTPAYLDEMAAFPTGLNDDQVDATSQALQRLVGKGPAKAKRPRGQMAGPRPGQSALPAQPTVAAVAGRGRLLPSTRPRRPLG